MLGILRVLCIIALVFFVVAAVSSVIVWFVSRKGGGRK